MEQLTTRRSRISLESIETLLQTINKMGRTHETERGRKMTNTNPQSNSWHRTRLAAASQNDFWIQVVGLRNQANAK